MDKSIGFQQIQIFCQRYDVALDKRRMLEQCLTAYPGVVIPNIDNPIGLLQERCIKEGWAPPKYRIICNFGIFGVVCIVNDQWHFGLSRSKKGAKATAAGHAVCG